MPDKNCLLIPVIVVLCAAVGGCSEGLDEMLGRSKAPAPEDIYVPPPYQTGTVAEYARMEGGTLLPVRGYGLVVGLGRDGSEQVPPHLKRYFIKYLHLRGIGSARAGTVGVTPERVLRDLDTAVVEINGFIPPGAPKGQSFDVQVRAVSGDVRSLDGGTLWEADMRLAAGITSRDPERGTSKILATAKGVIFVNPFLDDRKMDDRVRQRQGRTIGGGKVKYSRPIRLQLLMADFARANSIQRRINERFQRPGAAKVANAKNSSRIDITIPPYWKHDYEHFLRLVMHLPLQAARGTWEKHARDVVQAMALPSANHGELSLVLEAIGRRVLPIISAYYTNRNPYVAYYSARAALRLGDMAGAPEVLLRLATMSGSALQIEAISELGRHTALTRATPVLQGLLDDENDLVRVAAYEALRKRGGCVAVTTIELAGGEFHLDLVSSRRRYVIYATQADEARIALFGRDMVVSRPIFFTSPRRLVTINANKAGDSLGVFRRLGRTGKASPEFKVDPHVRSLIVALGDRAEHGEVELELADPAQGERQRVKGLGLTYGQVVSVLYRMCSQGSIPAKFVLQNLPRVQQFFRRTTTVGRPNMTEP